MKNPIFLPIFVDICDDTNSGTFRTGSSKECMEGVTTKLVLAKTLFRFDTITAFKDITVWNTAIGVKDIVPLYDVWEVAADDTEAVKYTTGSYSAVTEKEVKKMTCESYISLSSHSKLRELQNSGYTQIFEITSAGEVLGVWDTDGVKVKGQIMSEFDVAIRKRPVKDKPGFSMQTITFKDFDQFETNGIIIKEAWDIQSIQGIFDVTLEVQGTPTGTEIQVKALINGASEAFGGLLVANWTFEVGQSITGQTYDALTGIYTLDGTGLISGTLGLDGVITVDDWKYEATDIPVTI